MSFKYLAVCFCWFSDISHLCEYLLLQPSVYFFFSPLFMFSRWGPLIFPSPRRVFPICCSRHHASTYILQYPGESLLGRKRQGSTILLYILTARVSARIRESELQRDSEESKQRQEKERSERTREQTRWKCTPMYKRAASFLVTLLVICYRLSVRRREGGKARGGGVRWITINGIQSTLEVAGIRKTCVSVESKEACM